MIEFIILGLVVMLILSGLRILDQWEQGIILTLGKFTGIKKPGLRFIIPIIQRMIKVDMRLRAIDIKKQQVMTKDNVPVDVNGVVFFKVDKADNAIYRSPELYLCNSAIRPDCFERCCWRNDT